jgi:hypothetical protein
VGKVAQDLLTGGVMIAYDNASLSEQIRITGEEIQKGTITLYEAAFSFNNVFAKLDILHRGSTGWELYEVKATTGVEDVHLDDIALQYYVLSGSGLPVSRIFLVHLNNEYVRNGDLEVERLFTINDFTKNTKLKASAVAAEINRQRQMLVGPLPAIDIGVYCTNPYPCDFRGYCWQHIPKQSVFSIKGKGLRKFDLYYQGIVNLQDVPDGLLSYEQKIQKMADLAKTDFINPEKIKEFLKSLWYPLYFLDFETFMSPIPMFDGIKPYQHVPFQYSLHYLENENAPLQQQEFLAAPNTDPRIELLEKLLGEIPDNACVLAYHKSFEIGRLKDLAEWYPEHRERIESIISNMRDLADPFRQKDYYCYQMEGSYSLKAVLPALVNDLSYNGMAISDGNMAMDAYYRMCKETEQNEGEKIRKELLEYCRLDTLAMVKILEKLKNG